mgnify:CR=1 FL=1
MNIPTALAEMIRDLVDAPDPLLRAKWRRRLGYDKAVIADPRPLREALGQLEMAK